MANFCTKCGAPLSENALFCPSCGQKVAESAPANKTQEFLNKKRIEKASQSPARAPKRGSAAPSPEYRQYYNNSSPKAAKKKACAPVLSIILIAVLVIEFCVAGFKYPGFFVKKDPSSQTQTAYSNGNAGQGASSSSDTDDFYIDPALYEEVYEKYQDVDIEAAADREYIPEIHPISDIDLTFDETERASSPVYEAAVTMEEPVVTCGKVTVDFKGWNLENEQDTLIVKELPVKTDEEAGYTITAYDFSLASGQHEFTTNVTITIPRTEEDEGGCCVFFNEETAAWEPLYSEISEDGKYYYIHTSHFSDEGKASFSSEKIKTLARADTAAAHSAETQSYLSSFYYPHGADLNTRKDWPVAVDFDIFWKMIDSNYTLSLEELINTINATPQDDLTWSSPIPFETQLGHTDGVTGTFSLLGGRNFVRQAGKFAGKQLAKGNTSGFLASVLAGKLGRNVLRIGNVAGPIAALYSLYATPAKIYNEVQQGKSVWDAANNNKLDIIATAAGAVSLVGTVAELAGWTAVAASSVVSGAAVVGVGCYLASVAYGAMAPRDLSVMEQVYRDYYVEEPVDVGKAVPRRFHYDTARSGEHLFADVGVIDRITSLTDEESLKLKNLIANFDGLTAFNPRAYGLDSSAKKVYTPAQAKWAVVLTFLFKQCEKEPERLIKVLQEFYSNYANACWQIGEKDFKAFALWDMDRRGYDSSKFQMPSADVQKQYAQNFVSELMHAHGELLKEVVKKYEDEYKKAMETFIREVELPFLNTPMEFHVKGIDDTVYAVDYRDIDANKSNLQTGPTHPLVNYSTLVLPLRFACDIDGQYYECNGPLFLPHYAGMFYNWGAAPVVTDKFDYYPYQANFTPQYTGDEEVFTCTMYHYLLMGAPDTLILTDPKGKEKTMAVPFEIADPVDGVITVNIEPPFETPTPTPTPQVSVQTESGGYKVIPEEPEREHSYGSMSYYHYAIDRAVENATLTLNPDGTFSGSGSWSETYELSRTSEDGNASATYQETISATVEFSGRMGEDDDYGPAKISATVTQTGSTHEKSHGETEYAGYFVDLDDGGKGLGFDTEIYIDHDVKESWSLSYTAEGEGNVTWFMSSRSSGEPEEKCIMFNCSYDAKRTGSGTRTDDVVYSDVDPRIYDVAPDSFKDQHKTINTYPGDTTHESISAFYMFFKN